MNHVDQNDSLYQRIRSGDQSAVAEMIERNQPLVKSLAGKFVGNLPQFKHLFDDLLGEGFLALVAAVNEFATKEISKPTGYIVNKIDFALGNYADSEIAAGMMSERSVCRRRKRGDAIPKRLPFDVADIPESMWSKANGHVIRKRIIDHPLSLTNLYVSKGLEHQDKPDIDTKYESATQDAGQLVRAHEQQDSTTQYDLVDTILACCESEEDKAIVRLRRDGYTDKEIAEQLGISRQKVGRRRKEIELRFQERIK